MPFDRRERVISATVPQFLRELNVAFPDAVRHEGDRVFIDAFGATLQIDLEPMEPVAIALLRLPRLRARFRFVAGAPADCERLFDHLDRATQRGGG